VCGEVRLCALRRGALRSRGNRMKFLIDTNVFIPLEPAGESDIQARTAGAIELARLVGVAKSQLYVHPAQREDIERDRNVERLKLRRMLFDKYPCLPTPPPISLQLEAEVGHAEPGSNDWVDHQLLAGLQADAVDFLITDDLGLRRKAGRLGLGRRAASVAEAISIVRDLFDTVPAPPPAVQSVKAYSLDQTDPIFDGLRRDYPGFDNWLTKCKREHRQAWVIRVTGAAGLAAVCIVKPEDSVSFLPGVKVLKICSFKVSERYNGFRFGELLLKAIFTYAEDNSYEWLYVTLFEKYPLLISFLQEFGFDATCCRTALGEACLAKPMRFTEAERDALAPLAFNIRFGPSATKFARAPAFVVPIQPRYHCVLFPEAERQLELMPGIHPCGNSIRKAYLSRGPIRTITPGANLLFYRSEDRQHVTATGVAEDTLLSSSPEVIARYVGKRTVYSYDEISRMCQRDVLAILFRQSRSVRNPIRLDELRASGVVSAAPQSIVTVPEEAKEWLQTRVLG